MFNFHNRGLTLEWHKEPSLLKEPVESKTPNRAYLPLCQVKGENCFSNIREGAFIKRFEILSEPEDKEGCFVFSPFAGEIRQIINILHPLLGTVPSAVIDTINAAKIKLTSEKDIDSLSSDEIISIAMQASIIDEIDLSRLFEKLLKAKKEGCTIIVADAVQDEPYATSALSLLKFRGSEVIGGLLLAAVAVGAQRSCAAAFVPSELKDLIPLEIDGVQVMEIKSKYPAQPLLDMQIRGWGGGICVGADALAALFRAAKYGAKQTSCVVTVAGDAVGDPQNFVVQIGTPVSCLLEMCTITEEDYTIILGGIMGGKQCQPDTPVIIGVRAVIVMKNRPKREKSDCIGCSACVEVCPKKLYPIHIMKGYTRGNLKQCQNLNVELCISCGCCSYVCPSRIELTSVIHEAKDAVYKLEKGRKTNAFI